LGSDRAAQDLPAPMRAADEPVRQRWLDGATGTSMRPSYISQPAKLRGILSSFSEYVDRRFFLK